MIPKLESLNLVSIHHFGDPTRGTEGYALTTDDGRDIITGAFRDIFMFNESTHDANDYDLAKTIIGKAGSDAALFYAATRAMVDKIDAASLKPSSGAAS